MTLAAQRHEVTHLQALLDAGRSIAPPGWAAGAGSAAQAALKAGGRQELCVCQRVTAAAPSGHHPGDPTKSDQPCQPPASTGSPTKAATGWKWSVRK